VLVVDASAITDLLLGRPSAHRIEAHLVDHSFDLHAPHLLDVEVLSALRRVVASGDAPAARVHEAIVDLADLPIERYPHEMLLARVWTLRGNLSAYDAVYLALAEALSDQGTPLLTSDFRFARAARKHGDSPVVLAE